MILQVAKSPSPKNNSRLRKQVSITAPVRQLGRPQGELDLEKDLGWFHVCGVFFGCDFLYKSHQFQMVIYFWSR